MEAAGNTDNGKGISPRVTLSRTRRALAALTVVAAVSAVSGCGGGDSSTQAGTAKPNPSKETPAKAYATGRHQCRVLGGRKVLSANFGMSDPTALAAQYEAKVYIGKFPDSARRGCLSVLK